MKVAIIMGSNSDWPVLEAAEKTLKEFGVETEVVVASAHRTPDVVQNFAKGARDRGVEVIIAAAGAAAHLGGFIAAFTTVPVIGIPINATPLAGMDALLSFVQMPSGVPVATTVPPRSPPSGPKSMSQSQHFMTSKLCSIMIIEPPASTKRRNTPISLATSSKCKPVVGSSKI